MRIRTFPMRRRTSAVAGILLLALARVAPAGADPRPSSAEAAPVRPDADRRSAVGIALVPAERRPLARTIHASAHLDYDERKIVVVALRVPGFVEELHADFTGKRVRKGEPLLSLYAPDLVGAEQELVIALRAERELASTGASGASRSLVEASRRKLRVLGLDDGRIRAIERDGAPALHEIIRSPADGVVVEKAIVRGQSVPAGATLFRIADLSSLWAWGAVPESELASVAVGQRATLRLRGAAGKTIEAAVAFVDPTIDPKTRTGRVRLEVPNPAAELRPEMIADLALEIPLGVRLVLPTDAVLDSGRRRIVFAAGADGRVSPREVEIGERGDDSVEILHGVSAGDRVAASASFLLDAESQIEGADSMMARMGAVGMGDWRMESAHPMTMDGDSGNASPGDAPASAPPRTDEIQISVAPARGPAKVGPTVLRVLVRDADGHPIDSVAVALESTMDMPGMAIERVTAAPVGGGVYEARIRFTMAGPWGVVVEVGRPGGAPVRRRFTVRVAE